MNNSTADTVLRLGALEKAAFNSCEHDCNPITLVPVRFSWVVFSTGLGLKSTWIRYRCPSDPLYNDWKIKTLPFARAKLCRPSPYGVGRMLFSEGLNHSVSLDVLGLVQEWPFCSSVPALILPRSFARIGGNVLGLIPIGGLLYMELFLSFCLLKG